MNSGFWGLFARYSNNKVTFTEEKNHRKTDYTFDSESILAGINFGKRKVWKSGFTYTYRLGYGIPITRNLDWINGKPDNHKTYEVFYTIVSGLDGELSIGFCF